MEVLFFNLSLKLAILQAFPCLDPEQFPGALLLVPGTPVCHLLKLILLLKTSRFSSTFVLAGFTVNECRLQLKQHTLDAVLILIPSPPRQSQD